MLNYTNKLTSFLCSLIMPKHCITAVIEGFLINAHHMRSWQVNKVQMDEILATIQHK